MTATICYPFLNHAEYCIYVSDCDEMEEKIHDLLEKRGFRISENREFFKASIKQIKRVIF